MSGAAVSAALPRGRIRVSPRHAAKDTAVIVRAQPACASSACRKLLLFATVQPVMFLVLFNYVFGGAVGRSIPAAAGGSYLNWLLPGGAAADGRVRFHPDRDGADRRPQRRRDRPRFRSLPMARSAVLAGRTVADLVRNVFVIALVLALGYVLGFRPQTAPVSLAGGLLVAMTFGYVLVIAMVMALHRPERQELRGGAAGGHDSDVSAGVRQLRVRADRDAAGLAACLRRPSAGHPAQPTPCAA